MAATRVKRVFVALQHPGDFYVQTGRDCDIAVREMLVKKYTNRRLYDTEESRYITLEELAEKIRAGADATVVDARSGEDLTQTTLTQIIMESRGAGHILPVPLLLQLIRLGDEALGEFLGRYMSLALEAYLQAKQGAQSLAPYNPFATVPFAASNALARLMMGGGFAESAPFGAPFAAPAGPPPAAAKAQKPGAKPAETEMASLRRELDELKREVHRKRK
jgi:polyhydroxyalkanoate synthesis repressor PhaR